MLKKNMVFFRKKLRFHENISSGKLKFSLSGKNEFRKIAKIYSSEFELISARKTFSATQSVALRFFRRVFAYKNDDGKQMFARRSFVARKRRKLPR